MRFVDEFRDAHLVKAVLAEIAAAEFTAGPSACPSAKVELSLVVQVAMKARRQTMRRRRSMRSAS